MVACTRQLARAAPPRPPMLRRTSATRSVTLTRRGIRHAHALLLPVRAPWRMQYWFTWHPTEGTLHHVEVGQTSRTFSALEHLPEFA